MPHKIGWKTAAGLVLSNMVGTGVFTSLGFQLIDIQHYWAIVVLWILGGLMALIGAFTYAELGLRFQKSGGEYIYLSEALGPLFGFLAGWVSLVLGFAAPVAIAGAALVAYLKPVGIQHIEMVVSALIVLISYAHTHSNKHSAMVQNITNVFKIVFIVGLIAMGLYAGSEPVFVPTGSLGQNIFKPEFAVSFLYVTYAYTGWNAAAYIVEELKEPRKHLAKALITGVLIVTVLYALLQMAFMRMAPVSVLSGQTEVALSASNAAWGQGWGMAISVGIGLQLLATMSSYIWVGPHIAAAMGKKYSKLRFFKPTNDVPKTALWIQCAITLILFWSGSLQQILIYTSFILQLSSTMTVISYLKLHQKQRFEGFLSPYIQWIFVGFNVVVSVFILSTKPIESGIGLAILLFGVFIYYFIKSDD